MKCGNGKREEVRGEREVEGERWAVEEGYRYYQQQQNHSHNASKERDVSR